MFRVTSEVIAVLDCCKDSSHTKLVRDPGSPEGRFDVAEEADEAFFPAGDPPSGDSDHHS
jgi:hypothetical protein